ARRLSDRLRASWAAIHVETSRSHRLAEAQRDRIAETLRLAERLGGEAVTTPAADAAEGVLSYARERNFTHIVVARASGWRWSDLWYGSVTGRIIDQAGDIRVHVVAGQE